MHTNSTRINASPTNILFRQWNDRAQLRTRDQSTSARAFRLNPNERVIDGTNAFLFQNGTPVWPARNRTNGGSLCIGMYERVRNVGPFF